jgi:hypothetical protein
MEIAGRPFQERAAEALVVLALLVAFNYSQGVYNWFVVVLGPVIFFLSRVGIDVLWEQFAE